MLTLPVLRHALSDERLTAYALPSDADEVDAVARYLWNLACASALQPALHVAEVTFRNSIHRAGARVMERHPLSYVEVPCWLDAEPTVLLAHERDRVEEAKEILRRRYGHRSPWASPGRLVSALGFGFWTALCNRSYEPQRSTRVALWPEILRHAFIFAPKPARSRAAIKQRFDAIRALRNRVAHHEPVWDRDLPRAHEEILEAIGWMNRGVAATLRRESALPAVVAAGPGAFRARAEALFDRRATRSGADEAVGSGESPA